MVGRAKPADARHEERLRQPCGNLALRLGRAPLGTARCRQRGAGCGEGKLSWSRDLSSPQKLPTPTGAKAGAGGSSSFWLAEPCALGQRPSPALAPRRFPRCYFPFLVPLLILWNVASRCSLAGGTAMGGMQLPACEKMLPEPRGETEAEKCSVVPDS